MYYVYILQLSDNTCYIGFSSDLKQRVAVHKNGDAPQTKKKALDFELYLKTGSGFAFRNRHLI